MSKGEGFPWDLMDAFGTCVWGLSYLNKNAHCAFIKMLSIICLHVDRVRLRDFVYTKIPKKVKKRHVFKRQHLLRNAKLFTLTKLLLENQCYSGVPVMLLFSWDLGAYPFEAYFR
jgi:hypothetical protein